MNCPNCGAQVDSYHPFCSYCGKELNPGEEVSSACKELTEKLQKIDEDNQSRNVFDSVLKTIKGMKNSGDLSDKDQQKISLINGFSIPGTKTDIMEFLLMSRSNVDTYKRLVESATDSKQKRDYQTYHDTWKAKFDQAFSLGEIHLSGDNDFLKIKAEVDREKRAEEEKIRQKKAKDRKATIGFCAMIAVCLVSLIIMSVFAPSKEDSKANNPSNGISVPIHLECVPNLMFSKYDIDIDIDDEDFQRLEHGTTQDFTAHLTPGTHKIVFFEAGTTPVKGSIEFTVEEGTKLSFKLYCYDDHITIDDLENPDDEIPVKETEKANGKSTEKSKPEDTTKKQEKLLDVLTVDNCEDLKELIKADYLNVEKQEAFVNKYMGKTIEFDAVVYTVLPNPKYKTVYSYVLVPGTEVKDSNFGCVMFMLEDIPMGGMHWDSATRPEYLESGSKLKLRAKVETGEEEMYIYLSPVKSWGK